MSRSKDYHEARLTAPMDHMCAREVRIIYVGGKSEYGTGCVEESIGGREPMRELYRWVRHWVSCWMRESWAQISPGLG